MIKFEQKVSLIFFVLILLAGISYYVSDQLVSKNLEKDSVIEKLEKKTFQHPTFSFTYPDTFVFERGIDLSGSYLKPTIARIRIPKERFNSLNDNNFIGAYLTFSNTENSDRNTCLEFKDIEREYSSRKNLQVDGRTFRSIGLVEAAAGNIYESRIYRTYTSGGCFEAVSMIHTGNIYNYPAAGEVTEFSKEKAYSLMERIILSLSFN